MDPRDFLSAVFAMIGAFVLIYAATHDGELPRLFPDEPAAKDCEA